ncbi:transcription antitermination factor NusB [Patulibacter minatonensis]|uniref:transcription antitermination factor NusB n=1 Tax=Patulibacter minatonensis TaxID=298163 RepID=UPI0012F83040|nr:transcription antitermination factor NusB [Patulibacter minatonensis]
MSDSELPKRGSGRPDRWERRPKRGPATTGRPGAPHDGAAATGQRPARDDDAAAQDPPRPARKPGYCAPRGPRAGHGPGSAPRPRRSGADKAGAARRAAHEVVVRSLRDGAFADRALHGVAGELDPRERGQAKRLAFGAIQRRLTLDHVIGQHVDRELDVEVRAALHVGLYELLFSDGVPARAAVASAVELAKPNIGFKLVNAVLRRVSEQSGAEDGPGARVKGLIPPDDTPEGAAIRHSHPLWIVKRWWDWLGPNATRALLAAGNQPTELVLRANGLRADHAISEGFEVPGEEFDPAIPEARRVTGPLDVLGDPAWHEGVYVAMSYSSQVAARAVAPEPGERVLDLCAAPGGKTTHLADLMRGEGSIVALEKHGGRARALRRTCERVGATNVEVVHADALEHELAAGSFDRVLLDAPCSGLGTLASHPDLRWRVQEGDLRELEKLQTRLLEVADRAVRPGGRVVYSVCTLNPGEEQQTDGTVRRLYPHRDHTDGFYVSAVGG